MTMAQRKKKVAGIEQSEKYLHNREAKLDLHEEFINQPLNEDVEGKFFRWRGFQIDTSSMGLSANKIDVSRPLANQRLI